MSIKTKSQLKAETDATLFENTNQLISAVSVNKLVTDVIDSSFNAIDNPYPTVPAGTHVQPGTNIVTGGTATNPIVSTVASPIFANLTASGNTSLQSLSASTFVSGSTNLYQIFEPIGAGSPIPTHVQPGTNIVTGGTTTNPIVSTMSDVMFNSVIISGTGSYATSMAFGALTGSSIVSGTTNLYQIFQPLGAGSGPTGSGISNYVAKWNGTTALGDSIIYDNGTNVGIGTTSPIAKLHISATTEQLRLSYNTSNYYTTTVGSAGAVTFDAVGGSAKFQFNVDANINGITVGRGGNNSPLNTAVGNGALASYSGPSNSGANNAFGVNALQSTTSGQYNTAIGHYALTSNQTGGNNVAVGYCLQNITSSNYNIALGSRTLNGAGGNENIGIGRDCMMDNYGSDNIGIGGYATLLNHYSGDNNIALGYFSQLNNSYGANNVTIGLSSGQNIAGSSNIMIGSFGGKYETGSNTFYINNIDRGDISGDQSKSLLYGVMNTAPSNQSLNINAIVQINNTTANQLKVAYDNSNYFTTTVSSPGTVTFDVVGGSAGFIYNKPITITSPDDATLKIASTSTGNPYINWTLNTTTYVYEAIARNTNDWINGSAIGDYILRANLSSIILGTDAGNGNTFKINRDGHFQFRNTLNDQAYVDVYNGLHRIYTGINKNGITPTGDLFGTSNLSYLYTTGTVAIASDAGQIEFWAGGTGATNQRGVIKNTGEFGIGTMTPVATAKLEVVSTTQGVLFPRMTTTQKNAITSPAEGLMLYDITLHKMCVYTGSAWETITSL